MVEFREEWQEICFPFLGKAESEVLFSVLETLSLAPGASLYKMNNSADCLYFLVSGRIAVQKQTGFGDRMQVVALLDPGAPIGESGLFQRQTRGATLVAVTESRLLLLPQQSFDQLTATHPTLVITLLKWLVERMSLRLKKTSERLAHVL